MTREELQTQLRKTEELFYHATGKRMAPLWRAPFGEQNLEIRKWASELGYTHVAWTSDPKTHQNLDSLDWVPNQSYPGYFPALLVKDRILTFGQNEPNQANGGIVLMHLGTQRADDDRVDQWLPEIIKTFKGRGYSFITASQLVDHMDLLPTMAAK
jgi:peptidoglycan/xylan/chitin deacetylase (PgdA/CDA1 family)